MERGIMMNTSDKINELKNHFQNDPLYQMIEGMGLLDELFQPTEFFDNLVWQNTYSTKQAAELLGIPGKEQTLINYLTRYDLGTYLNVHRRGSRGYYRFDAKSIFQYKMMLLLNENGKTPMDVATIIGTATEYIEDGRVTKKSVNNTELQQSNSGISSEMLQNMFTQLATKIQGEFTKRDHKQQLLEKKSQIEKDLLFWESNMRQVVDRIEDIEMYKDIFHSVIKSQDSSRHISFWQRLFGKTPTNEEIENTKMKMKLVDERLNKLIEKRKELDAQKEELILKLSTVNNELEKLLGEPSEEKDLIEEEMDNDYQGQKENG